MMMFALGLGSKTLRLHITQGKNFNLLFQQLSTKGPKQSFTNNAFFSYISKLKWVPIPLGVGFAYISYQQFGHVQKRERKRIQSSGDPEDLVVNDWVVTLYRLFPLKFISCCWGNLNSKEVPKWLRKPLYKTYIKLFDCNLDEAAIRDLKHYKNLGEFFRRRLRPNVRPVDQESCVTCPADGKVLYFGKAEEGTVEQVKGIRYALQEFLGPQIWPCASNLYTINHELLKKSSKDKETEGKSLRQVMYHKNYHDSLKSNPDNELYHCVIYLAPGDYHGFHAPTEWNVMYRRHFPGELFSVSPGVARLVKGLFNLNERVAYMGEWKHGFFSMVAVGATNVGSIKVYHDKELGCTSCHRYSDNQFMDQVFGNQDQKGVSFERGDYFGEFNLGSTIVMVFEAPKDFEFNIEPGKKIKLGERIGFSKEQLVEQQA